MSKVFKLGITRKNNQDIKEVYSHAQGLSQCSKFIKENNLAEHIRADTAGSAEMISKTKDFKQSAIASSLSAKIYGLEVIKKNLSKRFLEQASLTNYILGKRVLPSSTMPWDHL